jgi:hypothetical protein
LIVCDSWVPMSDTYGTPPGGPDDIFSVILPLTFCGIVAVAFMLVAFPLVIVPSL